MTERRRPPRRGRGQRPTPRPADDASGEPNPYRDTPLTTDVAAADYRGEDGETDSGAERRNYRGAANDEIAPPAPPAPPAGESGAPAVRVESPTATNGVAAPRPDTPYAPGAPVTNGSAPDRGPRGERGDRPERGDRGDRGDRGERGERGERGRRGRRRGRGRERRNGERPEERGAPAAVAITPDTAVSGWFDTARDGGYLRRGTASYLAEPGDPFVPAGLARQLGLRRGDQVEGTAGRDHRGRLTLVEVQRINGDDPEAAARRPEFGSLPALYPERKLTLETGRPAKGGPELTRRAVDLIAPIGYGQRALIVAPARAGKTMLLHAITEGVAINHPNATLLILLVDERPEEVSEAISWGVGEVIASSFDQPAERHVEVAEMVLEHARRLVEAGKDVVIVLDSLTRLARAHNTAERGTGRTLSGGLDAQAMAKPKAFFGSARAVSPAAGGGSLTIIATALVETGSRMDDVIFEEFKGTGNCEIKLDRSLAEKRIFPAFDIATSGTRREEKLYRPDQIDAIYTLRRGLQQMPPQAAMEWLIKRIAATPSNDALLAGL